MEQRKRKYLGHLSVKIPFLKKYHTFFLDFLMFVPFKIHNGECLLIVT